MNMPHEAAEAGHVDRLYVNGFEVALSNSDVMVTLLTAGERQLRLHMSFTAAKTLSVALTQLVGTLQGVTGRDIMTMEDVGQGLEKLRLTRDGGSGEKH